MKRLSAFILVIMLTVAPFGVLASANDQVPAQLVATDASFPMDSHGAIALMTPDFPVVGKETHYKIAVNNVENLDSFAIKFEYNSDVLQFKEIKPYAFLVPMIVGAPTPVPPIVNITEQTENSLTVEFNANGITDSSYFYITLGFNTLKKGSTDIKITPVSLTDRDGKSYEMSINTVDIASETYLSEEIPDVSLLPEIGREVMRNGYDSYTVLSSREPEMSLISAVQNAENCDVKLHLSLSFILGSVTANPDAMTGNRLVVRYGEATVFETEIVLLGDVNGDGFINSADARKVLRYSAGIKGETLSACEKLAADVTDAGARITAADAREILRYSAGMGKTYEQWYEYHCANVR